MADKIKLVLAAIVLAGAVVAFYYFADYMLFLRVLGLLVAVGVATAIAAQTTVGAASLAFLRSASIEVRKVVWPTRKETTQMTLVILAMVTVMGLLMWGIDAFLAMMVRVLTG
ncbi:MAG: preprotein translocase subunit SecE [Thiohalomonadaceae bacterium]